MNIFYFRPGTQYQNSGDALINQGAVNYLLNYGRVVIDEFGLPKKYIDFIASADNKHSGKEAEVLTFGGTRLYYKVAWEALRSPDIIWVVYPPGDVSRKGWKSALAQARLVLITAILRLAGVKFIRLGFSIGPFDKKNGYLHSLWARLFDVYGLRDSASLRLASELNINKAQFFPDFSWLHGKQEIPKKGGANIAISFRGGAYGASPDKKTVGDIRNWLSNCHLKEVDEVVLFYQVEHDLEVNESMNSLLERYNSSFCKQRVLPEKVFDFYKDKDVVISNRLHVLLYAAKYGCLPIAVVDEKNNRKIVSLFRDAGLEGFVFIIDRDWLSKERLEELRQAYDEYLSGDRGYVKMAEDFGDNNLRRLRWH